MKSKTPSKSPNFLVCPVFPESEAPVDSVGAPPIAKSGVRPEQDRADRVAFEEQTAQPVDRGARSAPLQRAIPPVLPKPEAPSPERPRSRAFLITLFAIILVGILTAPALFALTRAAWAGMAAKAAVSRATALVAERDFARARDEIGNAQTQLASVKTTLGSVGVWRDLPWIGKQIRGLEDAAAAGASALDGLHDLFKVAADVLEAAMRGSLAAGELSSTAEEQRSFKELMPEERRAMLARLDRALPDMRMAQTKIILALEAWERVPQNELAAPLRRVLKPLADTLPELKRKLDEAVPLVEVLLPLVGYPTPSDWLVVLQNSDEIRATGGFLGTFGVLQVDGGDLKRFDFDDVYKLDNPATGKWKEAPPEPLKRWLGVSYWFFRDANWSPDFPSSASRLLDFYRRESAAAGRNVSLPDGVIALNPPFFRELLRITGPLTVDGLILDQNNFFDLLEYEVEIGFLREGKIPVSERKALMAKAGEALKARLADLPVARWSELLDAVTRALERRQIQVYARDPGLLSKIDALGWTGRTAASQGDFLWAVDSNVAALKTDGVMTKRVTYRLDATDTFKLTATVTLRYTNNAPGFSEYRYTRYRDYVRVYVPEGAELISVTGAMKDDRYRTGGVSVAGPVEVYKELGKTVFAAFWSIEPKTTQELVFTYRLPASAVDKIAAGSYRLDWPKQSGNDKTELTLDLKFGKKLRRAAPSEEPEHFGDSRYQVTSDSLMDRVFEVVF